MPLVVPQVPLPPSETQRLTALRTLEILDTLPEQAYDDLTMLAARLCGTPIALISLVDERRQWFKSRWAFQEAQGPRDQSLCTHAIRDPDNVLVVPDTLNDHRFCNSVLVTQPPHVRFYAGTPLQMADGHVLGTLCVLDYLPRTLASDALAALKALGRQVVALLELRRHQLLLTRQNQVMKESRVASIQYETQLRELNVHLHQQSMRDGLTGVYNRRAFDVQFKKAVSAGGPLSVIMVDVDYFKRFNDEYGHAMGDEVLRGVAECLQSNVRTGDFVARYGGEEFAIILPGTMQSAAVELAERLRLAISAARWTDQVVTVSAGVATDCGDSISTLLVAAADQALYKAKSLGRDRVWLADAQRDRAEVDVSAGHWIDLEGRS